MPWIVAAFVPDHPKDWTIRLIPCGSKFLSGAKDYGYTFTPIYTHDGNIRPEALPLEIKPFPVTAHYDEYSKEKIKRKSRFGMR